MDYNHKGPNRTPIQPARENHRRALTLDLDKYQTYLDDLDLDADQKRQFLEALWSIIVGFVDLGFSIEDEKQSCGQKAATDDPSATALRDALRLAAAPTTQTTNKTAGAKAAERIDPSCPNPSRPSQSCQSQ